MPDYQLKRELTDNDDCRIELYGPYDGTRRADGFKVQPLNFNREEATVAIASLEPGKAYEAMITLFGLHGGKVTIEIKPVGAVGDYAGAGSVTIPKNAKKRSPALGYVYATSIEITV